jgi:2-dehydro-3-deoxyphosphogluconate aldolase/(4S)-4-hydroxy-2-oxoglutarate aldolase
MRTKEEVLRGLTDPGVIAVIRARNSDQALRACEALSRGGIRALEITMTVPGAIEAIRRAAASLGAQALVGVGTVLDAKTCAEAIDAGAEFVVSPVTAPEVARAAAERLRPVMLGAYTPTEAQAAHEAGADFVKLFPAETLGPGYIKSLRGPLPHLRIVPTGGVDLETMAAFFGAGCAAVGVGSSLVRPALLEAGDWEGLAALARRYADLAISIQAGAAKSG